MNPSQESARSPEPAQPSGPPAADPTADPGAYGAPSAAAPSAAAPSAAASGAGLPAVGSSGDGPPGFPAVGAEVYGPTGEGGGYGLAHPSGPEPAPGFATKWWGMGAASPRPSKRTALVAVLSAVVVLVLGGPLGLLWAWIAPSVPVVATGRSIVVDDPSPEQYIAADGWYTLLGLGFGVLVAVLAWLVLRRDRGPFLLLGVVVGTLGAGYLVGPWVGEMIGKSGFEHWRETAVRGATYMAPPEVHSTGPKLVSAFAAAIVLTLLAGWSNDPDLDQPGARPGYGPNTAAAEPHDGSIAPSSPFPPEANETLDPEPAHPQGPADPPHA